MRFRCVVIVSFLVLGGGLVGCASTVFNIQTQPTNATVKLYAEEGMKDKVESDVEYKVENVDDFFPVGRTAWLGLDVEKEGYRSAFVIRPVRKGKENDLGGIIRLDKLNTEVSIDVDPPGATIRFYKDREGALYRKDASLVEDMLIEEYTIVRDKRLFQEHFERFFDPGDMPGKVRTGSSVSAPWTRSFSDDSFGQYVLDRLAFIRIEKEGYIPEVKELNIQKGESNYYAFKLRKMNTTLKVISEPEGVEVEDIRADTGFGYLGKAPFIRTFTFEDTAARQEFIAKRKIVLALRCTSMGYEDDFQMVEIPLGEEMTVKVNLSPRATEVTFQTDPPEAHVYLVREGSAKKWDASAKSISVLNVPYFKHLGTTPFTYYMDPADPLRHGDKLIYRKTGYQDGEDRFVRGVNNYHKVLRPVVVKER